MKFELEKQELAEAGFSGFVTMGRLMADISVVPARPGVYVVMRQDDGKPAFLSRGTGGFFKGEDPIYKETFTFFHIPTSSALTTIMLIVNLIFVWIYRKLITDEEPRDVEKLMIQEFKAKHGGRRPFANLVD